MIFHVIPHIFRCSKILIRNVAEISSVRTKIVSLEMYQIHVAKRSTDFRMCAEKVCNYFKMEFRKKKLTYFMLCAQFKR